MPCGALVILLAAANCLSPVPDSSTRGRRPNELFSFNPSLHDKRSCRVTRCVRLAIIRGRKRNIIWTRQRFLLTGPAHALMAGIASLV